MDSADILLKTEKGETEIRTRATHLASNLRVALILVDGHSSVAELVEKGGGLPDLQDSLRQLFDEGYVTATNSGVTDYEFVKQQLIALASEVLGKDATKVVKKLQEAPATREALLEVARSCKKMVQLFIDEKKAEELMDRCSRLLNGT